MPHRYSCSQPSARSRLSMLVEANAPIVVLRSTCSPARGFNGASIACSRLPTWLANSTKSLRMCTGASSASAWAAPIVTCSTGRPSAVKRSRSARYGAEPMLYPVEAVIADVRPLGLEFASEGAGARTGGVLHVDDDQCSTGWIDRPLGHVGADVVGRCSVSHGVDQLPARLAGQVGYVVDSAPRCRRRWRTTRRCAPGRSRVPAPDGRCGAAGP